jgi:WASH complex subunit CCDC53
MSESDSEYDVTSDGLSNIGSIPTKKTLMLVNNFITNTVDFMNKFASLCEKKLLAVSTQTQKLEITLNLLEAKLESVPWLDPATEQAAAPAAAGTLISIIFSMHCALY